MGPTTGIGLIGCGLIGRIHAWELSQLAAEDGMPITPVVAADPSADARRKAAETWGFTRFEPGAEAVLADPDVDAVWICTPTDTHPELVLAALDAGKHVYCEKPLATRLETVRELRDAAASSGLVCQVGFESRWQALPSRVRGFVESGDLGAAMGYVMRTDEVFPAAGIHPNMTAWRASPERTGGGTLIESAIHQVDLLCWTYGPVTRLSAATRAVLGQQVEDTVALTLTHESGVVGTLVSVWNRVLEREESRFEAFFENGIVEVTWGGVIVDAPRNSIRVDRGDQSPGPEVSSVTDRYLSGRGLHRPFFWARVADAAFVEAVRAGAPSTCDFDDALNAHAAVEAAYRSAASGSTVDVQDVADLLSG